MSKLKAVNVKRLFGSAVAAVALGGLATSAQAALQVDVRAVAFSGSGITINGAKSVSVDPAANGYVLFDVMVLVTGSNPSFQSMSGFIDSKGAGATGDFINAGMANQFGTFIQQDGKALSASVARQELGLKSGDAKGGFDEDGNSIPDGQPDGPGNKWYGNGAHPGTLFNFDTSDSSGDLDIGARSLASTGPQPIQVRHSTGEAVPMPAGARVYSFLMPIGNDAAKHASLAPGGSTEVNWSFTQGDQISTWSEDGGPRSALNGQATLAPVILSVVGDPGAGNNSVVVLTTASPVSLGDLLRGAKANGTLAVNNTGTNATTVDITPSGAALTTTPNNDVPVSGGGSATSNYTLNTSGLSGPQSFTLTVDNQATDSGGAGQGSADPNDVLTINANVGVATAGVPTSAQDRQTFGNTLTGKVAPGTSYAGLSSNTVAGQNGALGTRAEILNGNNNGAGESTVAMKWRLRTTDETPGTATQPPINLADNKGLNADVVDLTGIPTGQVYVLQMSYSDSVFADANDEASQAAAGNIYLVTLNENGNGPDAPTGTKNDLWVNAVDTNTGANAKQLFLSAYPAGDLTVGHYGVDTANNVVWAVVNHGGQFSVVPEPATFGLLGIAAAAFGLRRRRNA